MALGYSAFLPEDGRCAESLRSTGNPDTDRARKPLTLVGTSQPRARRGGGGSVQPTCGTSHLSVDWRQAREAS